VNAAVHKETELFSLSARIAMHIGDWSRQETAGRDAFIPKEMRISGAGPKVASHR
jgi:hypothetical protein